MPSYTCSDTEWLNVAELVGDTSVRRELVIARLAHVTLMPNGHRHADVDLGGLSAFGDALLTLAPGGEARCYDSR